MALGAMPEANDDLWFGRAVNVAESVTPVRSSCD